MSLVWLLALRLVLVWAREPAIGANLEVRQCHGGHLHAAAASLVARVAPVVPEVQSKPQAFAASVEPRQPDPFGIFAGLLAVAVATLCVNINRWRENQLISLFHANTTLKELQEKAARGEKLPSVVVLRGTISADGRDVLGVCPEIEGLRHLMGDIEQPRNDWVEIARRTKLRPRLREISDVMRGRTGSSSDAPDATARQNPYFRQASTHPSSWVLTELLVARVCGKHQRRLWDKRSKKVTIRRPCRNESYNCFHGRRVSEGLHFVDMNGTRAAIELPPANAVCLHGVVEPPVLFLPAADVWAEFSHGIYTDSLEGQSRRLDDLASTRLSDPAMLLSEFIVVDVQVDVDIGFFEGGPHCLEVIEEAFPAEPANKFLWEPRGFYDSVKGGGYNDVPAYANMKYRRAEMVTAKELLKRAEVAARENSSNTPFCEPTFTRAMLHRRRDEENCFRYAELSIPRDSPITILARPMISEAGTGGVGADCCIHLVPPAQEDEDGRRQAERFHFRILKGHSIDSLLRPTDLNLSAHYAMAVGGLLFSTWAALGYRITI